ncbi:hypothetical protein RVM24_19905 [Marinobacter sp. KM021]|uniref:hypothetical protein n=1 Tax=unclassified Marinobacter TaxID=83889 RepID=UPI0012E8AA56
MAEGPYRLVKPQGFGPGVFYRLKKGDGLMILAFGHFVSLLTKQTHNIVLSNIFIKKTYGYIDFSNFYLKNQ